MAWLTTPAEGQKRTRGELLQNDPRYTRPPDLFGCDYLLEMVSDIGLDHAGEPVTYQELAAYCQLTGVDLSPWESVTIREMSAAFCRWRDRARDPNCEPPVYTETRTMEQIRREAAEKVLNVFGGKAKRAKK